MDTMQQKREAVPSELPPFFMRVIHKIFSRAYTIFLHLYPVCDFISHCKSAFFCPNNYIVTHFLDELYAFPLIYRVAMQEIKHFRLTKHPLNGIGFTWCCFLRYASEREYAFFI